jgi:thymidylate synthase
MKPYPLRSEDGQYLAALRFILETGMRVGTRQGVPAITSFEVPKLVYDSENGFPLLPDRDMSTFWRAPIAELFSFIRGVRTQDELAAAGCGWWRQWTTEEKCRARGLDAGDLGPASYGGAFAAFPMADGTSFDQFDFLEQQLKKYPEVRTHFITPWIPYWNGRGKEQKAVVSPCHGWIHCRVLNGTFMLHMFQRSADFPVGVPANICQYAALAMALASLLGLNRWKYVHSFSDAHIYEDQLPNVRSLLERSPLALPTMRLIRPITTLKEVDPAWFELSDYHPHPGMKIPVAT